MERWIVGVMTADETDVVTVLCDVAVADVSDIFGDECAELVKVCFQEGCRESRKEKCV